MYRQFQMIQRERERRDARRPAISYPVHPAPEARDEFGVRQIRVKPYEPPPDAETAPGGAEETSGEGGVAPEEESGEGSVAPEEEDGESREGDAGG
jgi:hypothetical protein